jgi:uncharacterized Zn finger protein
MMNFYGGWRPYVSAAQRKENAKKEMQKLSKKGKVLQPVPPSQGRLIAKSFWGKGWCDHLDAFGDFANRLPRGRTYVRNGSVCHLAVENGKVEALVSGSKIYTVTMTVQPLAAASWADLKKRCTGKIGSLLELLQGRLSEEIMNVVTHPKNGLFPLPGQIKYDCNCPDWASMCKHVAAVIYGIGARLDDRPELLFLLRGVDHQELIAVDAAAAIDVAGQGQARQSRRRVIATAQLEDVFGVELETTTPTLMPAPTPTPRNTTTQKTKQSVAKKTAKKAPRKVAPAKKVPLKKVPLKKVPLKKVPLKKVPLKKVPLKKAVAKKAVPRAAKKSAKKHPSKRS